MRVDHSIEKVTVLIVISITCSNQKVILAV
jgi:hypothetical protein